MRILYQNAFPSRQRQAEGIAAARARGVHLDRPVLPIPDNFEKILKEREAGKITEDFVIETSGYYAGGYTGEKLYVYVFGENIF